jgi:hypothetical protein
VRAVRPLVLSVLVLAAAGCALQTTPHGRFAALTTRPAPALGYRALDEAPRSPGVEAVVWSQHFLWIPTRTEPPTLADAVEKALHRGDGDVLLDAEVDRLFFAIPLIYAQEGWRVRGDVVRTRPADEAEPPAPEAPPGSVPPGAGPGAGSSTETGSGETAGSSWPSSPPAGTTRP